MARNWLKDLFVGFLRARHLNRHFRRLLLLDSLTQTGVSREVPASLSQVLIQAAKQTPDELLRELESHPDGITDNQAEEIRVRVGNNEIGHEKPLPWWLHLWLAYRNPFNLLLSLLAGVSALTGDDTGALIIGFMVLFSTLLRFWQEMKANKAADALKAMVSNTATVLRRDISTEAAPIFAQYYGVHLQTKTNPPQEIPLKDLVPGDIVLLSAGDMIPAG